MRLGGRVFDKYEDPDQWVRALRRLGYRAAYCPVDPGASAETIRAYAAAAVQADVVIAEVGAWSNPLSPDAETRRAALSRCQEQLALAEAIGARCCVNISGSRGERWDGPHALNLTPETFALIVETVRAIIDAVKPTRAFYTLEPMPWMYPDSADSYLELIRAIDRPRFAVHLDVVNMIASPRLFYGNAALIRECVARLGPYVKSCHVKDIAIADRLTLHLDEVRPGLGSLDFRVLLRELARLDPDLPVMLEHMETPEEYALAADYVRAVARDEAVSLV
jgi:sugar phosphate isomerase/epimerase